MENNVLGSFSYKGLMALQNKSVLKVFRDFFYLKSPERIIEIGTEYGGLTLMMQDLLIEQGLVNSKIRTYDIKTPKFLVDHEGKTSMIEIMVKDLFNHDPFRLKEGSINELNSFMSDSGVNLILCDGGNKIQEFITLSKILKKNDVIMAHDYVENDEIFKSLFLNKIWNWKEIEKSDINEAIVENKLEPHFYNEFSSVAWGCFMKL